MHEQHKSCVHIGRIGCISSTNRAHLSLVLCAPAVQFVLLIVHMSSTNHLHQQHKSCVHIGRIVCTSGTSRVYISVAPGASAARIVCICASVASCASAARRQLHKSCCQLCTSCVSSRNLVRLSLASSVSAAKSVHQRHESFVCIDSKSRFSASAAQILCTSSTDHLNQHQETIHHEFWASAAQIVCISHTIRACLA